MTSFDVVPKSDRRDTQTYETETRNTAFHSLSFQEPLLTNFGNVLSLSSLLPALRSPEGNVGEHHGIDVSQRMPLGATLLILSEIPGLLESDLSDFFLNKPWEMRQSSSSPSWSGTSSPFRNVDQLSRYHIIGPSREESVLTVQSLTPEKLWGDGIPAKTENTALIFSNSFDGINRIPLPSLAFLFRIQEFCDNRGHSTLSFPKGSYRWTQIPHTVVIGSVPLQEDEELVRFVSDSDQAPS
jgi:hypothetical protein